ncbi:protein kintoun [Discoglossus pictus]
MATKLEDLNLSQDELDRFSKAFKDEKFREMFVQYAEEINDPENRRKYEEEISMMENERGMEIQFIHPQPGHVLRTSIDGVQKCYINVCSNDLVQKPECKPGRDQGHRAGQHWALPYSLAPGREDLGEGGSKHMIYDVVFHPDTLYIASKNDKFKKMVDSTALDAVAKQFDVKLDQKNVKTLSIKYKGVPHAAVLRKPRPGAMPKAEDPKDPLRFPYPYDDVGESNTEGGKSSTKPAKENKKQSVAKKKGDKKHDGATVPRYTILHRSYVDMQDYRDSRDSTPSPVPKELVVTVDLPLLKSAADVILDITGKELSLESKSPAYKLQLKLPYLVDENEGKALFNKARRQLVITMSVVQPKIPSLTETDSTHLEPDNLVNETEKNKCKCVEEVSLCGPVSNSSSRGNEKKDGEATCKPYEVEKDHIDSTEPLQDNAESLQEQNPAEPLQEQNPAEPLQEQNPAEPLQEQNPADTAEPLQEQNPAEPLQEENPADTAEPLQEENPADTTEPLQEENPADTAEPLQEQNPAEPLQEQNPAEPLQEQNPAEPLQEQNPAEPLQEQNPAEPLQKQNPAEPLQKQNPAEPLQKQNPAEPLQKQNPAEPLQKQNPAEPLQEQNPAEPLQKQNPAEPLQEQNPAEPLQEQNPADTAGPLQEQSIPELQGKCNEAPEAAIAPYMDDPVCPAFTSKQDNTSLTFIIHIKDIEEHTIKTEVWSNQYKISFCVKDSNVHYVLFLQFLPLDSLNENENSVSVSKNNAVVKLIKSLERSGLWQKLYYGINDYDLQERKFVTEENIKELIEDSLPPPPVPQPRVEDQLSIEVLEMTDNRTHIRINKPETDNEDHVSTKEQCTAQAEMKNSIGTESDNDIPANAAAAKDDFQKSPASGANTLSEAEETFDSGEKPAPILYAAEVSSIIDKSIEDSSTKEKGVHFKDEVELIHERELDEDNLPDDTRLVRSNMPNGGHPTQVLKEISKEDGTEQVITDHTTRCAFTFQNSLLYDLD